MSDAATVILPPPVLNDEPACWDLVLAKLFDRPSAIDVQLVAHIGERDRFGIAKYGTRLRPNDGRDPLVDAFQEALDGSVYCAKWAYEAEQQHGRWSMEHIEADGAMWAQINVARLLCGALARRGVR